MQKYLSFITKINSLLRLLIKLAILCIIISCFLTLFFQKNLNLEHEYLGSFIYISIMGSVLLGYLSIATIIASTIIHKLSNNLIWPNIKREVVLLLALALSVLIFYVCGVWVYK